jgi:UDP-glucose 4-epimerase
METMDSDEYTLVTGGLGYIGSHTVVELLGADKNVIILDNLCNSQSDVVDRISAITKRNPIFIKGDIRDSDKLKSLFSMYTIESVIHFAALKSVSESIDQPLEYFDSNVHGTLCLLREMNNAGVKRIVFSSSAAVYGNSQDVPIKENEKLRPLSPYGYTKVVCEKILQDLYLSDGNWKIIILRYFNPVGIHSSGLIGDAPVKFSTNLIPVIANIIVSGKGELAVYGSDYPTVDGSGVRDYIHVEDLAKGHIAALSALNDVATPLTFNLGTGRPYSVLEVLKVFEEILGKRVPFTIKGRRLGDIATSYADSTLANKHLNWSAKTGLGRMCQDALKWATKLHSKP